MCFDEQRSLFHCLIKNKWKMAVRMALLNHILCIQIISSRSFLQTTERHRISCGWATAAAAHAVQSQGTHTHAPSKHTQTITCYTYTRTYKHTQYKSMHTNTTQPHTHSHPYTYYTYTLHPCTGGHALSPTH